MIIHGTKSSILKRVHYLMSFQDLYSTAHLLLNK